MTQRPKVAIHGFGRIGRQTFKALIEGFADRIEVAAIGLADPSDARAAAHLLKYDSNYGPYAADISLDGDRLVVNGQSIPLVSAASLASLPWAALGIDTVIEASGAFNDAATVAGHLEAGANRVLVASPCDNADFTMIYGVNQADFDPARHAIISASSDTTNCLAPLVRVLEDSFGIESALMTTVHAYTNEQKLIDAPDDDLRRARSAPTSIVPTSTRADKAIGQVYPELAGRISGYAVRVPVPSVSILQVTAHLRGKPDIASVNAAFRKATEGPLGQVMTVVDEPLVSSDFRGCQSSAVVDSLVTLVNGPLVKVAAWYDNECGYAWRVADCAAAVAGR
jgi:glyceraldehyde 3-phosphate dehydrogenase